MNPSLDFYFFIGSTYSWLSVCRAPALARAAGVDLVWRPFSVRTLMREQNNVPFAGKPVKMRYMWRDVERRASRLGVAFAGAPPYPIDPDELANRVATLAALEGWCPGLTRAAYDAWFVGKADPGNPDVLRTLLARLGQEPERCLARAGDADVRAAYDTRTAQARELGLFGSPSFVCGSEVFWGDDRLEDAIDWALAHARSRPPIRGRPAVTR